MKNVISYLSEELDGLGHAVKNLGKHSHMIKTQCSQISKTQFLILAQLNDDNVVSFIEVLYRGHGYSNR